MLTTEERFWAKVDRSGGPEACWPWTAGVMKKTGYGVFHPAKTWTVLAHRFGLQLSGAEIPVGYHVDHTCHNDTDCPPGPCEHRICCNPAHLEAVKPGENVNRSHNSNVQKTHCPAGHEYTPENTFLQIKPNTTSRVCLACRRAYDNTPERRAAQRARRARLKAAA